MFVICFQIHLQGFKNQSKVAFFSRFALLCSSSVRGTELVPYLLVYKSNSCISRPLIFKVKNQIFLYFKSKK